MRLLLLKLARSNVGSRLVRFMVSHMSFAIPGKRLHETDTLFAFEHPAPAYPVHILLVPKRPIASLMTLGGDDVDLLVDVFATVRVLVERLGLEVSGYRLIANGGAYQDVAQLHFHLISGGTLGDND